MIYNQPWLFKPLVDQLKHTFFKTQLVSMRCLILRWKLELTEGIQKFISKLVHRH